MLLRVSSSDFMSPFSLTPPCSWSCFFSSRGETHVSGKNTIRSTNRTPLSISTNQ
jgi:hypothetical protein